MNGQINLKTLQLITGFSQEILNDYVKRGMPTGTLYEAFAWYFKDKKSDEANPIAQVKLDMAKLSYNRALGKLVNKELMEKRLDEALALIKNEIIGASGSLAMEVKNTDVQNCKRIIDKFLVERLNAVAEKVTEILDKKETSSESRHRYPRK